jgi:hypothetical protein
MNGPSLKSVQSLLWKAIFLFTFLKYFLPARKNLASMLSNSLSEKDRGFFYWSLFKCVFERSRNILKTEFVILAANFLPRLIGYAAAQAQKAADFVLGRTTEGEVAT